MVDLPGIGSDSSSGDPLADTPFDGVARVTCEFQDGTLYVLEDEVYIERSSRSKFEDKRIPMVEVEDVSYSKRFVISFIQIVQRGLEPDEETRFSTPVDENTLHLGRGKRDCAKRARDEIFARMDAIEE